MTYPKKIQNVNSVKAPERYEYFIRKAVELEEVWGLYDDGWAVADDSKEHKAIPFWPEKKFAEVCCNGVWESYEPKTIDLQFFIEELIPSMEENELMVAAFPTPEDNGVFVSASQLEEDLFAEMDQVESIDRKGTLRGIEHR